MASRNELTPCGVMFDVFKKQGHITHRELAELVLSTRPLADGRSPQSRADDRSWVSRFVVHAPVASLQDRYFADYGSSARRILVRLRSRKGGAMTGDEVLALLQGPALDAMTAALGRLQQNVNLYANALDRLARADGRMPGERAEVALVLFVAAGCSANVRTAVDYALDYAREMGASPLRTPRATDWGGGSADKEEPVAYPIGLLRVVDGYVVGSPHWISPTDEGIVVGALASADRDIADVGPDASAQHVRIWYDGSAWCVEDLGSTNGTVVVRGDDRVCMQVEAGRVAPLQQGDELRLGQTTSFVVVAGPPPADSR